jgi:hypothetical protein
MCGPTGRKYDAQIVANYCAVLNLLMKRSSGITCPDNSTSSTLLIGTSDLTNGSSALNGCYIASLTDGSTLWLKYSGLTKPQGTKFPRRGTATVVGGKGRYDGAKGQGTFEGDGTQAGGPEVTSFIDNVITIKRAIQSFELG